MSCKICGRGSCTESFHSIEEQERWESVSAMDERELMAEVVNLRLEGEDKSAEIDQLRADLAAANGRIEMLSDWVVKLNGGAPVEEDGTMINEFEAAIRKTDQLQADLTACRARVGELAGLVLMELQALHDKWAINRNDHGCVKDLGDLIVRLEQAWGGEG